MCVTPTDNNKRRSAYYETLSASVKKRYDYKIKEFSDIDPYTLLDEDMKDEWDDVEFELDDHDVGHFLIHGLNFFTYEQFKSFKAERTSANQAVNGYVRKMPRYAEQNDVILVKGLVSICMYVHVICFYTLCMPFFFFFFFRSCVYL